MQTSHIYRIQLISHTSSKTRNAKSSRLNRYKPLPPTKKNMAQSKMTDLKPTIPMLVSNVNIPRGHSKWQLGHTESLRHMSLGFGSDLL